MNPEEIRRYRPYFPGNYISPKYEYRLTKAIARLKSDAPTPLLEKLWQEAESERSDPKERWLWFVLKVEMTRPYERNLTFWL